jgi:hypothetical protein
VQSKIYFGVGEGGLSWVIAHEMALWAKVKIIYALFIFGPMTVNICLLLAAIFYLSWDATSFGSHPAGWSNDYDIGCVAEVCQIRKPVVLNWQYDSQWKAMKVLGKVPSLTCISRALYMHHHFAWPNPATPAFASLSTSRIGVGGALFIIPDSTPQIHLCELEVLCHKHRRIANEIIWLLNTSNI